jgi:membrane protein DedA with SNARE-associated domain
LVNAYKGVVIESLIATFEKYAERLPLEIFVLIGSFIEEAISPIPSFVVMIPAGAAAQVQGLGWWHLALLALIGAAGRLVASIMLYFIADKAEDALLGNGRKFFGISHAQLERYGKRLSGKKRDWWALFLLNAIPVLPTALLSLACGFVKVRFSLFVTATFPGTAINAFIYLSIGYAGILAASSLRGLELAFQIIAIIIVVALAVWFVQYRRQRSKRHSL